MAKFYQFGSVCCLLLVFVSCSQAAPTLRPKQAVTVATAFCNHVGIRPKGSFQVFFPPPIKGYSQNEYWQPRWLVHYSGVADVEVVDASNVVDYFDNHAFFAALKDSRPASKNLLTEVRAKKIALAALNAAGVTSNIIYAGAHIAGIGSHFGDAIWYVRWLRSWKGVPFLDQVATVSVSADDGTVLGLSLLYPTPPPVSTKVIVLRSSAEAKARSVAQNSGIGKASLIGVRTEIVRPNLLWSKKHDFNPIHGPARTALVYALRKGDLEADVWIDALNGNVIGGEAFRIEDSAPAASK